MVSIPYFSDDYFTNSISSYRLWENSKINQSTDFKNHTKDQEDKKINK